jgi:DNA-binding CsgD family transcriptional regulator
VMLRAATPVEILRLLSRIYALTARERELVRLLLGGLDTRAVGDRLHISAHTVQDHLKSIFGKTGMHTAGGRFSPRSERLKSSQAPVVAGFSDSGPVDVHGLEGDEQHLHSAE